MGCGGRRESIFHGKDDVVLQEGQYLRDGAEALYLGFQTSQNGGGTYSATLKKCCS